MSIAGTMQHSWASVGYGDRHIDVVLEKIANGPRCLDRWQKARDFLIDEGKYARTTYKHPDPTSTAPTHTLRSTPRHLQTLTPTPTSPSSPTFLSSTYFSPFLSTLGKHPQRKSRTPDVSFVQYGASSAGTSSPNPSTTNWQETFTGETIRTAQGGTKLELELLQVCVTDLCWGAELGGGNAPWITMWNILVPRWQIRKPERWKSHDTRKGDDALSVKSSVGFVVRRLRSYECLGLRSGLCAQLSKHELCIDRTAEFGRPVLSLRVNEHHHHDAQRRKERQKHGGDHDALRKTFLAANQSRETSSTHDVPLATMAPAIDTPRFISVLL
ncbi:hypothetical protein K439DRAFT_1616124 [Ramaria rubella]|nr:hypothetical protein K439DRAFT_1616124 [Ramaria rubella]